MALKSLAWDDRRLKAESPQDLPKSRARGAQKTYILAQLKMQPPAPPVTATQLIGWIQCTAIKFVFNSTRAAGSTEGSGRTRETTLDCENDGCAGRCKRTVVHRCTVVSTRIPDFWESIDDESAARQARIDCDSSPDSEIGPVIFGSARPNIRPALQ